MSLFFLGFELSVRRLYSVCLDLRGLLSDPLGVVSMPIKFNPHDHCKVPKIIVRGCGTRSLSEMEELLKPHAPSTKTVFPFPTVLVLYQHTSLCLSIFRYLNMFNTYLLYRRKIAEFSLEAQVTN